MGLAQLRIHHIEPSSSVNGPGLRCVIWVQGCSLGCPGCFNPYTHPPSGGRLFSIDELADQVIDLDGKIEGLTISGGEPLQQLPALAQFLELVKTRADFSVVLFSGYYWAEIQELPGVQSLLGSVDVLLAGRYEQEKRVASGLLGSKNKTLHFLTGRYHAADFETIPEAEIIIKPDGTMIATGIDPFVGGSHAQRS